MRAGFEQARLEEPVTTHRAAISESTRSGCTREEARSLGSRVPRARAHLAKPLVVTIEEPVRHSKPFEFGRLVWRAEHESERPFVQQLVEMRTVLRWGYDGLAVDSIQVHARPYTVGLRLSTRIADLQPSIADDHLEVQPPLTLWQVERQAGARPRGGVGPRGSARLRGSGGGGGVSSLASSGPTGGSGL